LTRQPPSQISKCRCGPVADPVWPTLHRCWPIATAIPPDHGERVLLAVGEEVRAAVAAVHDDVVAGAAGLVVRGADGAGDGRDDGEALRGGNVLTLVDVAVAPRAEATAVAGERVGPCDRERVRARRGRR
jgi:hypothetical protein